MRFVWKNCVQEDRGLRGIYARTPRVAAIGANEALGAPPQPEDPLYVDSALVARVAPGAAV